MYIWTYIRLTRKKELREGRRKVKYRYTMFEQLVLNTAEAKCSIGFLFTYISLSWVPVVCTQGAGKCVEKVY